MNIINRGTGYMPDGTRVYIEDWTCEYQNHYVTVAYPISKATLHGSFSPNTGEKFRYGINFDTFNDAADCADALMRGEKTLADYCERLERREYAVCV